MLLERDIKRTLPLVGRTSLALNVFQTIGAPLVAERRNLNKAGHTELDAMVNRRVLRASAL